jgi:subtilase family serine protease
MSSGADVTTTNTLVATFPNGALGAGGVSVESRQLAIPSTMPPGDYWLLLQVDPENRIAEADSTGDTLAAEANNGLRSLARIRVGAAAGSLPDLTAASVGAPVEVRRGVAANVTCEVVNQGSAVAASFTVRFYLSLNRTVEVAGSDVLLGTRSTAPLAVGGRTMLQAFLTVPATQATGNYFILAEIDPSNAIPELVETNNLGVSSQVTVSDTLTLADLVADSLAFSPSRLEPGGTLSLTWSIRNVGGRPAPPFRLQFFASGDTAVGSPDPLLASLELPTLAAGESLSDVTTAALPATVTTGAYFVGMAADGDARIVEADERNNTCLAPGTLSLGGVLGGADLSGVQVSTPTSATIGGPMLLVLEVRNNGPVGVTAGVVNRVWLSSDSVVDAGDRLLDEFTLQGVAATAVVTASRTVFVPRVPPGSYHVLFAVDATNAAAEEIETNNVSDKPILLRGAPDLRIDGFVAPTSTLQAGIPFPVQLLVSNGGNAVAQGPILCRILLSFDGVLDPSDLVLRPIIYPGNLAVGAQASLDTTAAVPDYVSPGSYRLIAVVDPTQTVLEEDESNNVWVQPGPISLGGAADLRAYGVQAPASAVAGGGTELLVAVSVQNTGVATAAACDTGFFLSTDRTINAADTFLGSVRTPRLLPGEVAVVQGGFVLPGAFPAGSYYVIARADTGNTVPELDESSASNDASAPGLVTVVAASTERARVVRFSTSAVRPDAVPAGPVTLSVEYDRPLASAPRASVRQPGTNHLPASPMGGSGRTWSIVYSVPSHNGSFNLDGTNRFSVTGGADSLGLQAEDYTTAAAFVTDTLAPSVRFTYPTEGAVVSGVLLVTGTVADASGGGRVLLSSTGGATSEVVVSAGRFEQQVALAAELSTIVARASDPAGNPSVEARVTVRLDSDGDGMPDDWERLYGLNPADPSDASGDPDLDGLSNLQEFRSGTAPFVADTDGDGVGDGLEVAQGTDPVHGSNRPPVTRAREGAASALDPSPRVATLDGTASLDDDGDPVRYAWSQVSGASCQLLRTDTPTPAAVVRAAGTYVFRLVTSDGKVNGLPGDVSVSVSNVTPTADAGVEQVVAVGGVVRLDGSGSTDPNGDVLAYSWSESAANPTLGLLSGGSGAGPTFTPTRAGKYEFLLRVTDPAGLVSRVAKTSVRVFEHGLVMAPRADAGLDDTVDTGTLVRLDGHESVDPDGSLFPVAYLWTQTAGPPGATRLSLLGATTVNPSFTPTAAGIYTFQLTVRDVSDDGLESAPDWVEIRVNSPAAALPLAVAGADRTSTLGETVVLDGSGSVARGGGVLVFQWSQVAGPPVKLELADQAMALVTPLQAGSYAFELLVTEGNVNSRKSRVWVHLPEGTGGGPPAAKARMASPQSSLASENRVRIPAGGSVTVTLDGTASYDPLGVALRYCWRQTAGPSAVLSSESAARPTFSPLVSRVYGFELTVSNGWLQATTGIDIAVDSPFNSVPTASVATVSAVKPGATVTFDGSRSSDPDGGSLLYRWVQTAGLPVTLTGATTARPSFTPPAAGLYKFQLYVDDGRDRSIPTEFTVLASQSGSGTGSTGSTGQPAGSDSGSGGGCAAVAGAGRGTGAWPAVFVLVWLGVRRRRVTSAGGARPARE